MPCFVNNCNMQIYLLEWDLRATYSKGGFTARMMTMEITVIKTILGSTADDNIIKA